jgi:hypothetical protein
VKEHPTLVLLDFGFTRATTVLGELGNVMGDEGVGKVAELLRVNKTLRSLDLLHNGIGQVGIDKIREALPKVDPREHYFDSIEPDSVWKGSQ